MNKRCAVYTRKSTEEGLEKSFNSLDAQRDAGEAYIKSQAGEDWICLPDRYDDGGYSGGDMERPALLRLLADIMAGKIDVVVVYKVDRLTRRLLDFAKMVDTFDQHHVAFVSVTQLINTATSMGRLMLNVLLSFAQFEREIISERTADKMSAARRKGLWLGGQPILGYDVVEQKLVVNPDESEQVRKIYALYLEHGGLIPVVRELERRGWRTKCWTTRKGNVRGGRSFDKSHVFNLLTNPAYLGKVRHKDVVYEGEHDAIVSEDLWGRVQAKLQRNGRTGGEAVRNQFGAILKGLLHCVPCSCAMSPTHSTRDGKKRYRYYACQAAQKKGWDSCPCPSIPAGEIERFVVEQIKVIGRDPTLVAETIRQAHQQARERTAEIGTEERRLERELSGLHQDLRKLADQSGEAVTARLADVHDRIQAAERRQSEIRDELERLRRDTIDESAAAQALAAFDPIWESLTPREQARLLQLLIERIDYDGRDGTIAITFHPCGIKALAEKSTGDAA